MSKKSIITVGLAVVLIPIVVGRVIPLDIKTASIRADSITTGVLGTGIWLPAPQVYSGNLDTGVVVPQAGVQGLTSSLSAKVAKGGDTMTGSLDLASGSTLTVRGDSFSVGTSTLVVKDGGVGIGYTNPGTTAGNLSVSGSIGIGKTNPAYALDAGNTGTVAARIFQMQGTAPNISFGNANNFFQENADANIIMSLADRFFWGAVAKRSTMTSTGDLYVSPAAKVGIGTSSPATILDVVNGTATFRVTGESIILTDSAGACWAMKATSGTGTLATRSVACP